MKRNMLCELCRREPAELTVCLASKSGRREEQSLCSTCARDRERMLFGDSGVLLTDLVEVAANQHSSVDGKRNRTKVCPRCGNTADRVKEAGEVGCSMCYTAFRDEIDRVIYELQGRSSK